MILTRPRLRDCYLLETGGDGTIFLLVEGGYMALSGRLYSSLLPLINGRNSPEDMIEQLDGTLSEPEVYYGLSQLEKRGLIAEAVDDLPPNIAAYWDYQRLDPNAVNQTLARATVTLTALDEKLVPPFAAALESLGIHVAGAGGFPVVLTDDYARTALDEINRRQLAARQPWMLIKPVGTILWLGPLFQPGQTGCWECLVQRLRSNRMVEGFLLDRKQATEPYLTSRGWLPTTLQAGMNLAANEVAKVLSGSYFRSLEGEVVTLDTMRLSLEHHTLIKRPQCPACGDPDRYTQPRPIVPESRIKQFTSDGGHRIELPEQTFDKLSVHVSPITGVISSLTRGDTGTNPVIHAYVAGHNFAQSYPDLRSLRRSLRTKAGGKGATDIQAKVSALGEAIERYAGVYRGDEVRMRSTYRALGSQAVDVQQLLLYSDEQYRTRKETFEESKLFHVVPRPFDPDQEIDWTPVWSMTNQTFKYVPTAHCYYNYAHVVGMPMEELFCLADSNGCAAGNTIEEAILQGFMEVVERDCVAMFWYNRIPRPAVDLDSFDEPFIGLLREHLRKNNRQMYVLDITNDLNVPAFCGVMWRTDRADQPQEIVVGFGAHFDAKLALMRALTECNQFLAGFEYFGETDQRYTGFDPLAAEWWRTATFAGQPYLVPDATLPTRRLSDFPQTLNDDLRDDVELCVKTVGNKGMEMLVLDQTRPDVDLKVAKVIVPGARHFWRRYAPGRLYDVPVQLGWLQQPRLESELNPFPVFF
jgi:ribosomal protein S12 methylthiotransferase accessory factor